MSSFLSLEFHGGAWGPPTDREPDATVNLVPQDRPNAGWHWEAARQRGVHASLGEAQRHAELAFYKARCAELHTETRGILHDLENATQALRALLGRMP